MNELEIDYIHTYIHMYVCHMYSIVNKIGFKCIFKQFRDVCFDRFYSIFEIQERKLSKAMRFFNFFFSLLYEYCYVFTFLKTFKI